MRLLRPISCEIAFHLFEKTAFLFLMQRIMALMMHGFHVWYKRVNIGMLLELHKLVQRLHKSTSNDTMLG